MAFVEPPKRRDDYPDREIDCAKALEASFQELMFMAIGNGWSPREARRALWRLIAADSRSEEEMAKLATELAIIRPMERTRR